MEFTTRFGLHSQTIRLLSSLASYTSDSYGPYTLSGQERHNHVDLESLNAQQETTQTPHFPLASHQGIRFWAFPCSLADTKGILVSFFSSAY